MKIKGLHFCSFDPFEENTRFRQHNNEFVSFATSAIPVAIDGSIITNQGTTTSNTSITVGSNSNRALIAIVYGDGSANPTASVTGAANSFTKMGGALATVTGQSVDIWISLNPSTGSNSITATAGSGTAHIYMILWSLYNVEQTTGYYSGNTTNRAGLSSWSNPSPKTPTNINSLLLDGVCANTAFSSPIQTSLSIHSATGVSTGSSYASSLGSLSAITFGWTNASAGSAAQTIVEIRAFGT